eukprot:scaffold7376_cov250-Pinguiococcus_pyrenoidosus.AAC.9
MLPRAILGTSSATSRLWAMKRLSSTRWRPPLSPGMLHDCVSWKQRVTAERTNILRNGGSESLNELLETIPRACHSSLGASGAHAVFARHAGVPGVPAERVSYGLSPPETRLKQPPQTNRDHGTEPPPLGPIPRISEHAYLCTEAIAVGRGWQQLKDQKRKRWRNR